jgi:hypothetical protein
MDQSCSGGSSGSARQDRAELRSLHGDSAESLLSRPNASRLPGANWSCSGASSASAALDAAAPLLAFGARPDVPLKRPEEPPAQGGAPQAPCGPASSSPVSARAALERQSGHAGASTAQALLQAKVAGGGHAHGAAPGLSIAAAAVPAHANRLRVPTTGSAPSSICW